MGKRRRRCVELNDSRGVRRRTRGVENGRMGVRETGDVVNHRRSRCARRSGWCPRGDKARVRYFRVYRKKRERCAKAECTRPDKSVCDRGC